MSDTKIPPPAPDPAPPSFALPPLTDLPHDSRQANIIICSAISFAISAIFVALRFYTRGFIIRVLGPTDWSILLALIFSAATTVSLIEQAVLGSGRHVWDLDPTDMESGIAWGRSAWMGILFYLLSLCFSKVSILLLYIHIFAFKWARRAGQILLGIVIITSIYMLITTCTACIPLQSYWDFTMEKKYCHAQSIWWSNTGLHMVTDFLIFLVPMPVVWTILLPKRQKIILFGVFGLGFIVCFISILRLLQLVEVENHPDPDFTFSAVELSYLTAVEINGAIVVACVMTLKPFIVKHLPGLLTSRRGSSDSSSSGQGPRRRLDTLSPPTIGSRPSKVPISPVDSEMMGVGGGGAGSGMGHGHGRAWGEGGYVELGDAYSWGVDVDVEAVGGGEKEKEGGSGRSMGEGVIVDVPGTDVKEKDLEKAADGDRDREGEKPPPVPAKTEGEGVQVHVQKGDR